MAKADDGSDFLVASIHIGTTYSGYAFGMKRELTKDPTKVYCPSWHVLDGPSSSKTSTTILLDENRRFVSFGYEAEKQYAELADENEHKDYYYFHRFKMILYEKIRTTGLNLNTTVLDIHNKELPAIEVFSHAIRFMKNHLLRNIERHRIFIEKEDIFWILTIPAIWDSYGMQFMTKVADMVNIDSSKLKIRSEPEAVSMWCTHLPFEKLHGSKEKISHFEEGSRFLVLDAGGGTIDIFVLEVKAGGKLRELERASWRDWGGTSVDEAFKKMFCDILGGEEELEKYFNRYPDEYLMLNRIFEIKKRNAELFSKKRRVHMSIPIGFWDTFPDIEFRTSQSIYNDSLQWKAHKLRIDTRTLEECFKPACEGVIGHINEVLQLPNVRGIQSILMVGGFSDSPVLQNAIKKTFSNFNILIPEDPSLAVLKGAVLLHDKEIYATEGFFGIESKRFESDDTILLQIIPHKQNSNHCEEKNVGLSVSLFKSKNKNSTCLENSYSKYMGNVSVPVHDIKPANNTEFKITIVQGGKEEGVTVKVATASGFKTELKFNCE